MARNEAAMEEMNRRLKAIEDLALAIGQQNVHQANGENTVFKRVASHHPPTFKGTADPVTLENWIRDMEKLYEVTNCPESMKVSIGSFYLKEEADSWWSTVKTGYLADDGFNWEMFKERLRDRFYPDAIKWQKQEEFSKFRMTGKMTVQEYTDKFIELSRFAPNIIPTERDKARKYERGLTFKIQKSLGGTPSQTFQEAYERALNIYDVLRTEEEVMERSKRKQFENASQSTREDKRPRYDNRGNNANGGQFQQGRNTGRNFNNQNRTQAQGSRPFICKGCGKEGHPGKKCNGELISCFECGGKGHKANQCPSKQIGSQVAQPRQNGGRFGQNNQGFVQPTVGNRQQNNNVNANINNAARVNPMPGQNVNVSRNPGNQGRIYVMNQTEAAANPEIITGTFLLQSMPVYILFDTGASLSFISSSFASKMGMTPSFASLTNVATPTGAVIPCSNIYENVLINIAGSEFTR